MKTLDDVAIHAAEQFSGMGNVYVLLATKMGQEEEMRWAIENLFNAETEEEMQLAIAYLAWSQMDEINWDGYVGRTWPDANYNLLPDYPDHTIGPIILQRLIDGYTTKEPA